MGFVLIAINSRTRERRVLLLLALGLIALFGALLVATSSDGHVHAGGAAILSLDLADVERAIEVLLCVAGVMTATWLLRPACRRRVLPADVVAPPAAPPRRNARRVTPLLPELCRSQV